VRVSRTTLNGQLFLNSVRNIVKITSRNAQDRPIGLLVCDTSVL